MSYLVLARRWRPQRFSALVGQEVVARTLKNALAGNSLAHAYLLTGIRGVGKTTIARLMAMAVNCQQPAAGEPCGACAPCQNIAKGSSLDVQEMDAASHTGVDDIREILDSVRYPPVSLPCKVYIVDEAHMLSKSAFNALLKTLEEPPPNVLFILATTEVEKLPITVRSRCQRFDLRRLGAEELVAHLSHILQTEGVGFEEAALQAIARAADGSARDALSLTERVLAYSPSFLREEDVRQALGLVGGEALLRLSNAILAGDASEAVTLLRSGMGGGHSGRSLLTALSELWHQLACLTVDAALLAETPSAAQRAWLEQHAGRWSLAAIDLRYQILLHGLRDLPLLDERRGSEMIVMRLALLHLLDDAIAAAPAIPPIARQPIAPPPRESVQFLPPPFPAASPPLNIPSPSPAAPPPMVAAVPATPPPAPEPELTPKAEPEPEQDLPLHQPDEAPGRNCRNWEEAVEGYRKLRIGIAAMLENVVCIEFGDKRVRLALDRHLERAITPPERLAFIEWLGREIYWEAKSDDGEGESLTQSRRRKAEAEERRLWQQAESDPHVGLIAEGVGAKLVKVLPPGVPEENLAPEEDDE